MKYKTKQNLLQSLSTVETKNEILEIFCFHLCCYYFDLFAHKTCKFEKKKIHL